MSLFIQPNLSPGTTGPALKVDIADSRAAYGSVALLL